MNTMANALREANVYQVLGFQNTNTAKKQAVASRKKPKKVFIAKKQSKAEFTHVEDLGIVDFKTSAMKESYKPFRLPNGNYAQSMVFPFGKGVTLRVTVFGNMRMLTKLTNTSVICARATVIRKIMKGTGTIYNLDLHVEGHKKADTLIKFLPVTAPQDRIEVVLDSRKGEGFENMALPQGGYISYKKK